MNEKWIFVIQLVVYQKIEIKKKNQHNIQYTWKKKQEEQVVVVMMMILMTKMNKM